MPGLVAVDDMQPILVKIIGAPVACKDGVKDSWRQVAEWAAGQLSVRYSNRVRVLYYNLFDPNCPKLAMDSQLPVVFVDDILMSSGGKISIPLICKKIDELD